MAVRSDAALMEETATGPSEGAEQNIHPPGFEMAARAEHQSEAAAMRSLLMHQVTRCHSPLSVIRTPSWWPRLSQLCLLHDSS